MFLLHKQLLELIIAFQPNSFRKEFREIEIAEALKSILYFLMVGLHEIGGDYLVWRWLREGRSRWYAIAGAAVLALYGIIPSFQPADFGRV